jgi:hypothetical protein
LDFVGFDPARGIGRRRESDRGQGDGNASETAVHLKDDVTADHGGSVFRQNTFSAQLGLFAHRDRCPDNHGTDFPENWAGALHRSGHRNAIRLLDFQQIIQQKGKTRPRSSPQIVAAVVVAAQRSLRQSVELSSCDQARSHCRKIESQLSIIANIRQAGAGTRMAPQIRSASHRDPLSYADLKNSLA